MFGLFTASGNFGLFLLTLDWTLRIALAVHVIMRRRPVSVSLAWLSVVLFVPVFGLCAYLLVGENRLGIRRRRRHDEISIRMVRQAVEIWRHRYAQTVAEPDDYRHIARYGQGVTGIPPMKGHRLSVIDGTDEFLDCLAQDIEQATSHVHVLTYIWQPTPRTRVIAEALARAAQRGVICRVLVDAVGGGATKFFSSGDAAMMRNAGVRVVAALPVNAFRMLFARLDLRNHRKIAVIDGHAAYCGSQNITDTTFRSSRWRKTGPWIDATLRLEGPAAQLLGLFFLRDWQLDSGEDISDLTPFLPAPEADDATQDESTSPGEPSGTTVMHEASGGVQIIPSGPGPTPDAIHQALLTTIYSAREELIMTTPYFVPDDATRIALQSASTRGVDVVIVMPAVSDSIPVALASKSHYLDLLEAGVRILHYHGGLLHSKTLTVDRKLALISSANVDMRSFWLNFEISAFVYDDDFASLLRFMQVGYMDKSTPITLQEWRKQPWWRVFVQNAAQLLGPLL